MLEKMKKDLEKEFSKICDYNSDCENKRKVLRKNTNDFKLTDICIIVYFSTILIFIASININLPITMGLALPLTALGCVGLTSSIAIGCAGQAIITFVSKKEMKKFTDAKTNADILEEMMYYEMEIDKSKNKKEVLRKMYEKIESKQQILSDYSSEFYQIDKYAKLSPEALRKRQEMLTKAYNEQMEQLDVLTSQAYLKDKFKSHRKKSERIENIISSVLKGSLPSYLLIGLPFSLELMGSANLESMVNFVKFYALFFSPTLVVAPLSMPYFIKRNKGVMNAFNNLNQSLGENSLSAKPNVEYENELNYMIFTKIGEIVELGMEKEEIGYAIEKRSTETTTESKGKSKEKTLDDLVYTEEEIRYYTPESLTPFDLELIFGTDENIKEQTDNLKNEQSGPRLVKKRIPPKK